MDFCNDCDSILEPREIDGKIVAYCEDCKEVKNGTISSLTFENKKEEFEKNVLSKNTDLTLKDWFAEFKKFDDDKILNKRALQGNDKALELKRKLVS